MRVTSIVWWIIETYYYVNLMKTIINFVQLNMGIVMKFSKSVMMDIRYGMDSTYVKYYDFMICYIESRSHKQN